MALKGRFFRRGQARPDISKLEGGERESVLVCIIAGAASQKRRRAEVSLYQGESLELYPSKEEGRRWNSVIET